MVPRWQQPEDGAPEVPGVFGVDEDPYTDDDSLAQGDPESHDD